jgi:CDP-glucose 4,6-dehydratase
VEEESLSAFWRGRPTFVTGGSGFLGSWIVSELLARGAQVICLVRGQALTSELIERDALGRARTVQGDIRDQALLETILREHKIVTVFHLAAQTIVGTARQNPATTLDINIGGTTSLLEACRNAGTVEQIVIASSDKAYGDAGEQAYDENTPLRGTHPYEVSKACADLIAHSYAASYGLPVVITRCGNFCGPGDLNWNRIVPGTIRALLEGQRPVIRSDGKFVRDYFYIEDGAGAHLMLAEQLAQKPALHGEAFNFSNETRVTVLELVHKISALLGCDLSPEVRNEASNEIRFQTLSAAKARREFGWRPRFTLDEGLTLAIAWYRTHLSGSK